jgi:AcrR family transcriptional regulator
MTFSPTASDGLPAWRARALDRTLEDLRTRSEARLERLVGAARDLAGATGSAAFTVAQVAEAAGCSLKGFYACFASKDELLLALLEDDSRVGASLLAQRVDAAGGPAARLRAFVRGIFELVTTPGALGYAGVLVREHRRLSEEHPDELDAALAPIVDVLVAQVHAAAAAGLIAPGDVTRDAQAAFALVLSGVHDVTLGRRDPDEAADHIATFVWRGLGGRAGGEGT